jgi:hypothetical protein
MKTTIHTAHDIKSGDKLLVRDSNSAQVRFEEVIASKLVNNGNDVLVTFTGGVVQMFPDRQIIELAA